MRLCWTHDRREESETFGVTTNNGRVIIICGRASGTRATVGINIFITTQYLNIQIEILTAPQQPETASEITRLQHFAHVRFNYDPGQ
jgi:hypothetical protein